MKINTIVDTFEGSSLNAQWNHWGTLIGVSSGWLYYTTDTAGEYGGVVSTDTYDLTDSHISVELLDAGNQGLSSLQVFPLLLQVDMNNHIAFIVQGGTVHCRKYIAGVGTSLYTFPYNSVAHRWFQIRENDGIVYFETSINGQKWNTNYSVANPITVTALEASIQAGTWGAEATTTTIRFDNLNFEPFGAAFETESIDSYRNVVVDLKVSWKKDYISSYQPFTIGMSLIGGSDPIASSGEVVSDFARYNYFDETSKVISLDYERGLNMPLGGLTKALASVRLDNTSRRFMPYYMGGDSELFTALVSRRPMIIQSGFDHDGILDVIPQFIGITTETPKVTRTGGVATIKAADFNDFLQNRYIDQTSMFTSQRSDQIIQSILQDQGYSTAQYDLDVGIGQIPFAMFEKGAKLSDVINKIVQAENGHFYQDEEGTLIFENRQHWDSWPYNEAVATLHTSQVLEAESVGEDHLINVVEVKANARAKQPTQPIWQSSSSIELPANSSEEIFVNFEDPILEAFEPRITANSSELGDGTDVSSSVTIQNMDVFAQAAKLKIYNASGSTAYITNMIIYGRPARLLEPIYYRGQRDAAVTAFEERPIVIENDYIQNESWAQSLAELILEDYAFPENLQKLTIRAMPQRKIGDLISWQGRNWRIYGQRTVISADSGFIQEIDLLQRDVKSYFRIGISTVGGGDLIAP